MEARLFPEGEPPEWTTPEWYAGRETAPHLEQEGHRDRLLLTANMVEQAIVEGAKNIIDLGAGDGGLLSLFPMYSSKWQLESIYGYDLQQSNVDAAEKRGVQVDLLDVVNTYDWLDDVWTETVVVATEMLEHLVDPHQFVQNLKKFTRAEWLVASSPYTETAESHYEFHTWAWDLEGYRALLENNGWEVVRQETAWISQVLLARRK
jgi:2-polyprenyl-3-methyl-5-hydroxy-6-metoxy-1,4-benzoquinol methylase